jgi:hypothetical protein
VAAIAALFLDRSTLFLPGSDLRPSPLPLPDTLQCPPALFGTESLQGRSPAPAEHLVAAGTIAGTNEKYFMADYPRGIVGWLETLFLPALEPVPIAQALCLSLLFSGFCFAVFALRLPPGPLQCRQSALSAAIQLEPSFGAKSLKTSFKQTTPRPRPTTRNGSFLIFEAV